MADVFAGDQFSNIKSEPSIEDVEAYVRNFMLKSDSPFVDTETLQKWLIDSIKEALRVAKQKEELRIEKLIASKNSTEIKAMVERIKFKHGTNRAAKRRTKNR